MIPQRWTFAFATTALLGAPAFAQEVRQVDPLERYRRAAIEQYAEYAHRIYSRCVVEAKQIAKAIDVFVADPSARNLASVRRGWLDARDVYGMTEVLRFYNGPIDNPSDGPETLINAWPLDESYVDYVEGANTLGIVGDAERYPNLDETILTHLNERGGEANVAVGWHAIEFLLWGQDLSKEGPGARSHEDYVVGVRPHAARRGHYLSTCGRLLVRHLEQVAAAWAPDVPDNYRARFVTGPSKESFRRILAGMVILSGFEMSGERLAVAWETRDQEEEHSCFSDNTHADFIANQRGVLALFRGDAPGLVGLGIGHVGAQVAPELVAEVERALEASLRAVKALPVPFDEALRAPDDSPAREKVYAALLALEHQSELLALLALELGYEIALQPGG